MSPTSRQRQEVRASPVLLAYSPSHCSISHLHPLDHPLQPLIFLSPSALFPVSPSGRPATSADSRAVRVNLPVELGGGFTMVVCQLSSNPTVRSLTTQSLGMAQATNTSLLEASDWGLSLPPDDSDDDPSAPRVFLHPDTAISLILQSNEEEPTVDLLRLRASRPKTSPRSRRDAGKSKTAQGEDEEEEESVTLRSREVNHQPSDVQRISSDDAKEADRWSRLFRIHCSRGQGREARDVRFSRDPTTVRSPFDPPPIPTPPHLTQVRYSLLQQLKKVHPPHTPLPTGLTCLLFPPPLAPSLLTTPSSASLTPNGTKPKVSKDEKRREEERKKDRDKEVVLIESLLTSLSTRGIGHFRPPKSRKGDEDDDEGKDEEVEKARKQQFAWCVGGGGSAAVLHRITTPPCSSRQGEGESQRGGQRLRTDVTEGSAAGGGGGGEGAEDWTGQWGSDWHTEGASEWGAGGGEDDLHCERAEGWRE